eukprot:364852-Chlamydomonas_euryale.AAC.2
MQPFVLSRPNLCVRLDAVLNDCCCGPCLWSCITDACLQDVVFTLRAASSASSPVAALVPSSCARSSSLPLPPSGSVRAGSGAAPAFSCFSVSDSTSCALNAASAGVNSVMATPA